jgi:hypothetical protein
MGLPFDQVVRQERFIQDHPEWSIHPLDGATRFIAEKGDNQDCHVVAALSLRELLNRLEEIVAAEGPAGRSRTRTSCGGSSSSFSARTGTSARHAPVTARTAHCTPATAPPTRPPAP